MKLGNQVEQREWKVCSELILPLSRSNFSFANLFGHFNIPILRGGMGVKKASLDADGSEARSKSSLMNFWKKNQVFFKLPLKPKDNTSKNTNLMPS